MTGSVMRLSLGLFVWGGCLVGSLSIADWPGELGHGICGPWGCGPPMQALIACHLAWLVALLPPAVALMLSEIPSSAMLKGIGQVLAAVAALALLGMLVHQCLLWWPQASEWQRPYFWQRYGFTIATTVDIPLLQVLLIGLGLWLTGGTRRQVAAKP